MGQQGNRNRYSSKKRKPSANQKGGKPRHGGNRSKKPARKPSSLDPALLVKDAVISEQTKYRPKRRITELPINDRLIQQLAKKGYEYPTEIQDKTLDRLLQGRNMLGIAQTGTGKTGAFLIPIIEQLLINKKKTLFALIVVPTRELAVQVSGEFKSMTAGLGIYSNCFIGGTNINKDLNVLRRDSQVTIATPGRLLDLSNQRAIDLRRFRVLVLDEFDRMLDMGFAKEVDRIVGSMQNRKQTMLFSATLDRSQQKKIDSVLHKPAVVKVATGQTTTDQVQQEVIKLKEGENKFRMLTDLLADPEFSKVILFDETKHRVNRLCGKLNKAGFKSVQIQGNKSQNQRQKALNDFKQGKAGILVATDVAGRGIDVDDVTHVINYQLPMTYDAYIHRIGRTGRAGKVGRAITFVDAIPENL